jgi:WD40 repeat protein
VPTGRLIRQIEKNKELVLNDQNDQSAFRDEKTLVVVRNRCIETLDLATGRRVRGARLFDENLFPGTLLLSPDGKTIVTVGDEGIRVVDTATGKDLGQIRAGQDWMVAFHPRGKVFAVEQRSRGTIQIYDTRTLRGLRQWRLQKGLISNPLSDSPNCVFVPGGNLLANLGAKGAIDLWDWTTGAFVRKLGESMGEPCNLTFSRDGKLVASGADGRRIRVFDVVTGKELLPIEGPRTSIGSIRYIDRDTLVATTVGGGPTFTWDVRTARVVRSMPGVECPDVLSPDGKWCAHANLDGTVFLLDRTAGKKQRLLGFSQPRPKPGPGDWPSGLSSPPVAFSSDGSVLAYADPYGPIRLWRVATGVECGRLRSWPDRSVVSVVKCLTFSRDGRLLAVGRHGRVEVWDTARGKRLMQQNVHLRAWKYPGHLTGPLGGVQAVVFTPNGRAVTLVNWDGPVRLWEVSSGRQLLRPTRKPRPEDNCTAVACSPDGRLLASAEYGSSIILWEIASGREVARFRPTAGRSVHALAFSPDSRFLASGGDDPTVLLWKVPDGVRKPRR